MNLSANLTDDDLELISREVGPHAANLAATRKRVWHERAERVSELNKARIDTNVESVFDYYDALLKPTEIFVRTV